MSRLSLCHCRIALDQRLAEWVAVQSVSAWPEKRGEIKKMMQMAAKDIERLGGTVEMVDIGQQTVRRAWERIC